MGTQGSQVTVGEKNDGFLETLLFHCLKASPAYFKPKNHHILALGAMTEVHFPAVTPRRAHFHLAGMDAVLLPLLHEAVSLRRVHVRGTGQVEAGSSTDILVLIRSIKENGY